MEIKKTLKYGHFLVNSPILCETSLNAFLKFSVALGLAQNNSFENWTLSCFPHYSCAAKRMRYKCPPFLVFRVTLVHGNLCLHTFKYMTVTLRGAGGRGLFKTINSC